MNAAVDVGSNTVRMLLGDCPNGELRPHRYERQITRLAGGFTAVQGLAEDSMERTLAVLKQFADILSTESVERVRAVGTEALRRAVNGPAFVQRVRETTGLPLEIISGTEEAGLMTRGILSVIDPLPENALLVDIGGASTELVCVSRGEILAQQSYPFGVVRLCDGNADDTQIRGTVAAALEDIGQQLKSTGLVVADCELIGTAGTVTTLAAIHQQLISYDASLINNHFISTDWLKCLEAKLESMTVPEREALPGMEKGRGDLILPGLRVVLGLLQDCLRPGIKVADSGLLEGILLETSLLTD